jgi:tRNA dimethylallyltransferase
LPILVGGTGFYLRALVRPLFESPNTDMALRGRLRRIAQRRGPVHLHKMLFRLDPQGASSISPRNEPRTTRALEVYFQTGKRISELRLTPDAPDFASRVRVVALNPPRDELYARINARAAEMFTRGLVEEVERLIASGIPPDAKAFQAHGYRRVVEYLRGLRTRESTLEQMKLDTRHYAKRQLTWWRGWPGVSWINRFGDDPAALAEAREILLSPPSGQAV